MVKRDKHVSKNSSLNKDVFYRKSKEEGWRARSAFKLLQIDSEFNIFENVKQAVDLCAAPGSWSQCLQRKILKNEDGSLKKDVILVSVDLQEMEPIEGINIIQGDITSEKTYNKIIDLFKGTKADLVICDGAPDVTGLHDIDEFIQSQLILAALNITTNILNEGGSFVAKIFKGKDYPLLKSQLEIFFEQVYCTKPTSSRVSSAENFVVCKKFKIPKDYVPKLMNPLEMKKKEYVGVEKKIIPFLSCGDLSGFDE